MRKALVIGFGVLLCATFAQANMFTNGSFEDLTAGDPGYTGGPFTGVDSGSIGANEAQIYTTAVTGWTTGANGIEIQTNTVLSGENPGDPGAHHGTKYVELDADNVNSYMSQQVSGFAPGQDYAVSFYYRPRGPSAGTNGVEVYLDTTDNWNLIASVDGVGPSNQWLFIAGAFSATVDTHTIIFRAVGTADGMGGLIDSASLEQVPEPATMALVGVGLMGLYFVRRRRQA